MEGEYSQIGGRFKQHTLDEIALQTAVFNRKGTERVIRYAFELAEKRNKLGGHDGYRGMVTNCSKSNALNYAMVFWDEVYNLVAARFPDIKQDFAMVDALSMWFIKNPEYFDVVVASNLFGDIITDLGAMLQCGNRGCAPDARAPRDGISGIRNRSGGTSCPGGAEGAYERYRGYCPNRGDGPGSAGQNRLEVRPGAG